MNGEIPLLVTDWLYEFEKYSVHIQDYRPIADRTGAIYGMHFKYIMEIRKILTCHRLNLETIGY